MILALQTKNKKEIIVAAAACLLACVIRACARAHVWVFLCVVDDVSCLCHNQMQHNLSFSLQLHTRHTFYTRFTSTHIAHMHLHKLALHGLRPSRHSHDTLHSVPQLEVPTPRITAVIRVLSCGPNAHPCSAFFLRGLRPPRRCHVLFLYVSSHKFST